jgi:hypothetical protein
MLVARFSALMMGLLLAGSAMGQGIYTCVDAKGRKITADRPIAECTDRSQHEVSPTGTVRRVIPPSLTAQERAALEEKEKQDAEARLNQLEQKRRDRALLTRFATRADHDKERALALEQVNEVIRVGGKRVQELTDQRKSIALELEFYKNDLSKAPPAIKRRLDENDSNMAIQKRFIADQEGEKKRVNQLFDEQLVKLRPLWNSSTPASSPPKP